MRAEPSGQRCTALEEHERPSRQDRGRGGRAEVAGNEARGVVMKAVRHCKDLGFNLAKWGDTCGI